MNDTLRPYVITICRVLAVLCGISSLVCFGFAFYYNSSPLIFSCILGTVSSLVSAVLCLGLADAESYIEEMRHPEKKKETSVETASLKETPKETPAPIVIKKDATHAYPRETKVLILSTQKKGTIVDLTEEKNYTVLLDEGGLVSVPESDLSILH